ncbi:TIR domain-containing protein [Vibrio vulnificus]
MARKIFVSYKYADEQVQDILNSFWETTKVRDYVNKLEEVLDENDEIYKGEKDGQDLSDFKDSTIETHLKNKIFDSSITIVLVSKGMKDWTLLTPEDDQWIPWEISYSLKEITRNERTSRTNAVLAVVIPDENGSYDYYIQENTCPHCNCRTLKTDFLFGILKRNMFNKNDPEIKECDDHTGGTVYTGRHSYIQSIKWEDFIKNPTLYLDIATEIKDDLESYNISKLVTVEE